MANAQPVRFDFICQGLPADTFAVNRLQGDEGLSRVYRFEIELRSRNMELDFDHLLAHSCRLSLWVDGVERRVHGILSDCELLQQLGDFALYRVVLVPRLWQLGLYHANEVFLDKSVPDILRLVLEEGGFTSLDYELNLVRNYRSWPYRCQYAESHFDFLQRLMEREGIYYFFEQAADSEKLIIVDHLQFHESMPSPKVSYDPATGLAGEQFGSSLQSLVYRQKRLARSILLRDYNDNYPSVDIKGQADIDAGGMGEVNVFGLNILSPEEGRELAEIHAEQLRCTRQVFHGESTVGRLMPGYSFTLDQHFRSSFNQAYLIIALSHSGQDPTLGALGSRATDSQTGENYSNSFTAIPASVQYRPEPCASKPQVQGNLDAIIDAEGDGQYAEVDNEGRYKVILPFDRQTRDEGKASHWVRMSQAFAGENEGMHFPLRKGAHVLLSFIGGDPDRPVITGAMPTAGQPSVITANNQSKSKIQTRAGNMIEIEDKDDSKRIKLYSPHENTYFHLGAHNAPGNGLVSVTEGIERNEIGGGSQRTRVTRNRRLAWADSSEDADKLITDSDDQLFNEQAIFPFPKKDASGVGSTSLTSEEEVAGDYHTERRVGDYYLYTDSHEYRFGGGNVFNFGNAYEESHTNTAGLDTASETFAIPGSVKGAIGYSPGDGLVSKTWGDTFEYSNGNQYSWGDTKEYSFGNGYSETIVTDADLATYGINSSALPRDKYSGAWVQINPANALVEKTIGDSYSYTLGNTRDVYKGRIEENFHGDKFCEYYGTEAEFYFGASSNMYFGASNDIFVGVKSDISLAVSSELSIGAKSEIFIGAKSEICIAAQFEFNAGPKTEWGPAELKANLTELKTNVSALASAATSLAANSSIMTTAAISMYSMGTALSNAAAEIKNGAIKIYNSGITLIN